MKKKIIFIFSLIFLFILQFQIVLAIDYNVTEIIVGDIIEYRFYFKNHHFMTIIDDKGTFNIRPHPGVDINGWGSSWYMQPFLPGAILKYTIIKDITLYKDKINVIASGNVSKDTSNKYGSWNISISFSYNQTKKEVNGYGTYNIILFDNLTSSTGDLNLFKIASNYLDNVPLLNGTIGDTGDMRYANVTGDYFNFIWIPPEQPGHFPYDLTDNLSIDVVGQFNNVNTLAQGHNFSIEAAYKPSLKITLKSKQIGIPMIFGGIYDLTKSQDFWEDNIGITPLILKQSSFLNYEFDVLFNSIPLPLDGIDVYKDCKVDIFDLAKVGLCYGCSSAQACWQNCKQADVKPDGVINIFDLATVGLNYGKSC